MVNESKSGAIRGGCGRSTRFSVKEEALTVNKYYLAAV
jgi:hypothetical protein